MNLKILKLRSGEEIAGQILEETDSGVKIFQPMIFRVISSFDDNGNPCDVTTLHDWLMNTDLKQVTLPMNHITFITEPNSDTRKLYELESVKEFDKNNFKTTVQESKVENNIKMNEKDADLFGEFLQDLINSASADKWNKMDEPPMVPKRKRKASKKNAFPPDMLDESELDRHMIMMQLYIPAEAIMNMITSGLLEPKVLLEMVKEVKKRNRFTGDEKNRKDFGDKFSDWNPDPNSGDYK